MITLTREMSPKQWQWRNHPSIFAWTRQNGMITEAKHKAYWERVGNDSSIEMFGLLDGSGANVGTCGLTSIHYHHGSAEFSLFIGPEYQGCGYGKQALQELLKYAFKHLRLNCVWGETFTENPAYQMFLKLGFQHDGTLRKRYFKNGEYVDAHAVSILKEEAEKQPWWN